MTICKYAQFIAVACLLAFNGCGDSGPTLVPATGQVLYQGKPVSEADVMFIPANGRPATARTNDEGRFELLTSDPRDGAIVGEHQVAITKTVQVNPNDTSSYPEMKSAIPEKYGNPSLSNLSAEVTEEGENDFKFELVD